MPGLVSFPNFSLIFAMVLGRRYIKIILALLKGYFLKFPNIIFALGNRNFRILRREYQTSSGFISTPTACAPFCAALITSSPSPEPNSSTFSPGLISARSSMVFSFSFRDLTNGAPKIGPQKSMKNCRAKNKTTAVKTAISNIMIRISTTMNV